MYLVQRIIIITVAALVGASVGKVGFSDPVPFFLGGGVVAAIAVGIAGTYSPQTAKLEKTTPPRKLLGLRIGTVGFVLAICGWLVTVFSSQHYGFILASSGIGIGFVGMAVHFINMFRK